MIFFLSLLIEKKKRNSCTSVVRMLIGIVQYSMNPAEDTATIVTIFKSKGGGVEEKVDEGKTKRLRKGILFVLV